MPDPYLTNKLNEYVGFMDEAKNAIVALTTFGTVGLGGLILAIRQVYRQMKGVEDAVEPVRHEIIDDADGTLTTRVDSIKTLIDEEKQARLEMHEQNSARFDRMEDRMDRLSDDVSAIRKMMDKILGKLARLN